MNRRADRHDFLFAAALSVLTVVSRLPYRARMLYNWDAVQFALAIREYDVMKHQPHPPGYVLYVALGRLVNAWLHDATAAYVVLAVVFSGLTTFVVYYLARAAYDRPTALASATLLAVSPLFWFYGSVGLTYAGEALVASTVAYFAFRALHGGARDAWLGAGYLGLAGGLRQSVLVLLFPLWLGSVAVGVRRWRTIAVGVAILALTVLSWFLPMVWWTGGLGRYLEASMNLAESVVMPTSILAGAFETTLRMSRYVLESILVALGPLALAALLLPWYVRRHGWARREWFFVAWMLPSLLVCTLVHFGQAGYVLTFLPALVILLSRVMVAALGDATRPLLPRLPALRALMTAVVVALVVLANGAFFVNARPITRDFETPRPAWAKMAETEAFDWIFSRTAAALREHEDVVRTLVGAIKGLYGADDTAVITEVGNPRSYPWMRHAMFYLPAYTMYELRVGELPPGFYAPRHSLAMLRVPDTRIRMPAGIRRLVWFVDHWSPSSERPRGLTEIELPYGRYLYVLPLGRSPLRYAGYTLTRDDPPRRADRAAR
jgi:4-amino-4-deoxy-L-arabinose transferase-like glycosyltransferase